MKEGQENGHGQYINEIVVMVCIMMVNGDGDVRKRVLTILNFVCLFHSR